MAGRDVASNPMQSLKPARAVIVSSQNGNPVNKLRIEPSEKGESELRSMLRGGAGGDGMAAATGVQRRLDSKLTRYDSGSQETIEEVRRMLAENPDNESLLDWLAFMMYTNGNFHEAVALYEKLIRMSSTNTSYHYYLANSFFRMGRIEKAITGWKKVVRMNRKSKMGRRAAARIDMAGRMIRVSED